MHVAFESPNCQNEMTVRWSQLWRCGWSYWVLNRGQMLVEWPLPADEVAVLARDARPAKESGNLDQPAGRERPRLNC